MLCMNTSAVASSACRAWRDCCCLRSSTTLFLLRLVPMNMAAMPGSTAGPVWRVESPAGGSILMTDRKNTRLNSSHQIISYVVFCFEKTDSAHRFIGDEDHATFNTRCMVPQGWQENCFFFNDTATTEIYPVSLHDALPISRSSCCGWCP